MPTNKRKRSDLQWSTNIWLCKLVILETKIKCLRNRRGKL